MLASSWPIKAPKHTVATANHGAHRCSRTTAGRARSTNTDITGPARAPGTAAPACRTPRYTPTHCYLCPRTTIVLTQSNISASTGLRQGDDMPVHAPDQPDIDETRVRLL